jgi:hypothetical protein
MNINELFEKIQDNFLPEDLKGEFTLHGNCIVWTYNLEDNTESINVPTDEDDEIFDFESISSEEILQNAYDEDCEALELFLDELEEYDNWSFSEPEIIENIITFKIF